MKRCAHTRLAFECPACYEKVKRSRQSAIAAKITSIDRIVDSIEDLQTDLVDLRRDLLSHDREER